MGYREERKYMVEFQLRKRGITNKKILDVFLEIPREKFIPGSLRADSYIDGPVPIGEGQTISQPYIVALMTELLEPKRTDNLLEIGTGSGYQSAILSRLVNKVVSVEIIEKLAVNAKKNLKKVGAKNVEVLFSDAALELKNGSFDKIIVTAATGIIPKIWVDILKEGGIILVPKGNLYSQSLKKYVKKEGHLEFVDEWDGVIFVPLTGKKGLIGY